MKTFRYILLCAPLALFFMSSCEKDLELYDTETCWLNFYYNIEDRSDYDENFSKDSYSFVFGSEDRQRDTLWYEVIAMGFVHDQDRAITIKQIESEGNQAVPGKHYVAFDDPSLSSLYVMPAGKSRTKIPVVILRDPSLKKDPATLRFAIAANENFIPGYPEYNSRYLSFTDMLSKPSKWDFDYPYPGYAGYYVHLSDWFGVYGVVKHQFLIEQTGKKWDDEFIETLMGGSSFDYIDYMMAKMEKRLAEVNAEREAQGLDVLKEEDGTVVKFGYY
ncbi:MAG: DUF4843 domain-containing protein [Prevotella sp.]|nr:DUF4843 domain-containing protein [Prevotella sp.]